MNPEPMPQMPTNPPVMDDAALLAEIGGVNPASPQMPPQMPAGQMPAGQMPAGQMPPVSRHGTAPNGTTSSYDGVTTSEYRLCLCAIF